MASDAAQLELNDFLLNLDSHLNPQIAPESIDGTTMDLDRRSRISTPEPPDEREAQEMRTRAISIRDGRGKQREDHHLNELADMVLRLAAAVPAREQILEQASTIQRLMIQQEFLLQRLNDEHAILEAEKDGTQRICEALIAQANIASRSLYKDQDGNKKPAIIEAENTLLRQKLSDMQSRASALEAELSQLRPLLLMQPCAIALSQGLTLSPAKPRKKEETGSTNVNVEHRSYYRVREEKSAPNSPPKTKKKKIASYFKYAPTVADARSEHLLLAARKLGKERATMLSQAMYRTAEQQPQRPSTAPNHDLTMHVKGRTAPSRPLMSPAIWPNHIQQPPQSAQQGKRPYAAGPVKGQQNPPFSQFGPTSGVAYPHPQQYFVPSGSVARPGTAMPFYHAPPRGYIPGPTWSYYSPGPYAFGQPIPIQNASANTKKPFPTRPTNSPPVAGPSKTPVPEQASSMSSPSQNQKGNEINPGPDRGQKSPSEHHQERGLRTPQSKTNTSVLDRSTATPMDSLLSAAESIFSPDSRERSPTADGIVSPSPKKRRRVERQRQGSLTGQAEERQATASGGLTNPERQTSALDVLADQAAGVDSSQRPRSRSKSPDGLAAILAGNKQARPEETSPLLASDKPTAMTSIEATFRTSAGARRGKRPSRASSIVPTSTMPSSSLAPSITAQRAASEEHVSVISTGQGPSDLFKLRPVRNAEKGAALSRSASLPGNGGRTSVERKRQTNGRASTPSQPLMSRTTSSADADNDAEGDEVELEDEMDAEAVANIDAAAGVDQLGNDSKRTEGSTKRRKIPVDPVGPSEDTNSKRWLEILGRKDP